MVDYCHDYEKAKNYAYRLLTFRPRTRYELLVKLQQKKYDSELIQKLLMMLEDYNLIDDKAFAKNLVQQKSVTKPLGKKGLIFQLKKFGISNCIIEDTLADFSLEQEHNLALSVAEKFFSKHNAVQDKQKIKNKLISLLQRRGFSYDTITKIINETMA